MEPNIAGLPDPEGSGNKATLDELMPLVYDHLHKLASHCLHSERRDHTLCATALVNEAYLRFVRSDVTLHDVTHFYALAARMLRRILVDHAKSHRREKRGGEAERISLEGAIVVGPDTPDGLVELDAALDLLAQQDPRKAQLIELLFFGGLTYEEAAEVLHISTATVQRDVRLARAVLYRYLK